MSVFAPDVVVPAGGQHRPLVVSLVNGSRELVLRFDRAGNGYRLLAGAEGLGAGDVDLTTTELASGGVHLDHQRLVEGEMFLPVMARSSTSGHVRELVSALRDVVAPGEGPVTVKVTDSGTGRARTRGLYYKSGLRSPEWSSPRSVSYGLVLADLDSRAFAADESTVRVHVVAAESTDGWLTPFEFPLVSTVSGDPRAGSVVNAGELPAPVRVRFQGPCTNPRVWADGFEAGYRGSLAHDQSVTLDGLNKTAILRGGGRSPRHVAGAVTRKTRLSQLALPLGTSNLWFEASDPTGTSFVDVSWRDTFRSLI